MRSLVNFRTITNLLAESSDSYLEKQLQEHRSGLWRASHRTMFPWRSPDRMIRPEQQQATFAPEMEDIGKE